MLRDFQKNFKNSLIQKNLLPSDHWQDSDFHRSRFGVYSNTVFVSLKETLFSTFSATANLVSHEFFRYLTDEYIKKHPPSSGCLDDYGQTFPEFITHFESTKNLPFLPDLAQVEWLMHKSSLEPVLPSLSIKALNKLISDTDKVQNIFFQPSIRLIASNYLISKIYTASKKGYEPDISIHQPEKLLVHKEKEKIHIILVPEEIFNFFQTSIQKPYIHALEEHINQHGMNNINQLNQFTIDNNLLCEINNKS